MEKYIIGLFAATFIIGNGAVAASAQTQTETLPAVAKTDQDDQLLSDARLSRKIDFRCEKAKLSDVLAELRTYTSARLTVTHNLDNITLHVSNAAIRDIMDSIAFLYRGAWKKNGAAWTLAAESSVAQFYNPHNAGEAEMYAQGRVLLDAMDAMSPELKHRFAAENPNMPPEGVSLNELPPEMQDLTQKMYRHIRQDQIQDPAVRAELPETLSDCRVVMKYPTQVSAGNDLLTTEYEMVLEMAGPGNPSGRTGVLAQFNVKPGPNPDYSVISRDEYKQRQDAALVAWCEAPKKSREKALLEDKRMNLPITLDMDRVSFLTAIGTLARAANISVATRAPSLDDNLRTFHFNKTPLHEALDQIAAAYPVITDFGKIMPFVTPETANANRSKLDVTPPVNPTIIEWGWRKSGMFLFTPLYPQSSAAYAAVKQKIDKTAPANGSKPAPPTK